MPKLLIFGLDAASPSIIRQYSHELPTMQKLIKLGVSGEVDTLLSSFDIWASYYTGLSPINHGVRHVKLRDLKLNPSSVEINQAKFFWDYLNEHRWTVGLANGLLTCPAPKINGFVWSGEPMENPHLDQAFHPLAIKSLISKPYLEGLPNAPTLQDLGINKSFHDLCAEELTEILDPNYFRDYLDAMTKNLAWYERTLMGIYRTVPVDMLFAYILELDPLQHFNFHEGSLRTIVEGYRAIDAFMAKLIEELEPENVLVVSDHGMKPFYDLHPFNDENFRWEGAVLDGIFRPVHSRLIVELSPFGGLVSGGHASPGFYCLSGPEVVLGTQNIHYLDIFPIILRIFGIPQPNGIDGRLPDIFR